jgi:hypothetical protein
LSNLIKYQIRLSKYWESVYFVRSNGSHFYTDKNQNEKIKSILFLKGYPEITKQYIEIDEYTYKMLCQYMEKEQTQYYQAKEFPWK